MRTRRHPLVATAALIGSALVLTACGGGTGGGPGATGDATSEAPATDATDETTDDAGPAEEVSLRFSWWGSDTRHTLTQTAIDAFEAEYPHISVEADFTDWGSYWDKLATSVAGGDVPDVITMEERYLADYATRGVLMDLTEVTVDTELIDDTLLQSGTIDGGLYAIATGANVYGVIADPQAFADAGVELPDDDTWTWDDYARIAGEVSAASGGSVFGAQDYGFNEPGLSILVRQKGEALYNADGTLGLSPETITEWWQRSIDMQSAGAQPDASTTVEVDAGGPELSLIGTNRGAMAWFWSNQLTAISNASGRELVMLKAPGESEGERTGMYFKPAMYLSMSASTEHPEEAALFMDWLLNSEAAGQIILSDRGLPANTEVRAAILPNLSATEQLAADFLAELEDHIVDGPAVPPNGAGQVADITRRINQEVLFEQISPEQAAEKWLSEVNKAIGQS